MASTIVPPHQSATRSGFHRTPRCRAFTSTTEGLWLSIAALVLLFLTLQVGPAYQPGTVIGQAPSLAQRTTAHPNEAIESPGRPR